MDGSSTSPFAPSATPFASSPRPGVRRRVWWTAMRSSTAVEASGRRSRGLLARPLARARGGPRRRLRLLVHLVEDLVLAAFADEPVVPEALAQGEVGEEGDDGDEAGDGHVV